MLGVTRATTMRIPLRDLFWLNLVAAVLLGWLLHWQGTQRKPTKAHNNERALRSLRVLEAQRGQLNVEIELMRRGYPELPSNNQVTLSTTHQAYLERLRAMLRSLDKRIAETEQTMLEP
jgi:hypothetical protein